jgi:hypothetical protein
LDQRTYGSTRGRKGRPFAEYFPKAWQNRMASQAMHVDPEFESFTYGDPTPPKRGLAQLERGDLLVFYAGMKACGHECPPALYLAGFFRVKLAGFAPGFSHQQLRCEFGQNYHVRHAKVFAEQREKLVLIKGGNGSRLFRRAHLVGKTVRRQNASAWQIITPKMEKVFGRFGGIGSLQRSTPRWVEDTLVNKAEDFVESLN